MFQKRVAEKLGVFFVVANYLDCPKLPAQVNSAAALVNSTLTVLSVEMTEKALPVLPIILAMINTGVENCNLNVEGAAYKWYDDPDFRTFPVTPQIYHVLLQSSLSRATFFARAQHLPSSLLHSCHLVSGDPADKEKERNSAWSTCLR